jgi:hypothetical protein
MTGLTSILFLPLVCAAAGRPAEIESLADSARAAPAEFAADAMIRIAGIEKLEKGWRVELLEEAFRRATAAKEPYRRRAAFSTLEGLSGFWNRVYAQRLDGLSLQLRAIDALLPLNAAKARDLFLQIAPLSLPRLSCEDALVYDVSHFYHTLAWVANQAFTPEEIKEEEPFKLIDRYVRGIASPAQVAPVARVIASARVSAPQLEALVVAFAGALEAMNGDDRSFTSNRADAGLAMRELLEALRRREMSPVPLLEAYRAYLVRHYQAARCADSEHVTVKLAIASADPALEEAETAANAALFFNQKLRVDPVAAITDEERTAAKVEGEAVGQKPCESSACAALAKQYLELMMGPDGMPYAAAQKGAAEWQNKLREFLSRMAAWKQGSGETAAEHFRFRCSMYTDLLALAPGGAGRDTVLRAMLDFLKQNRLQAENPLEWFLPVNILLGRVSIDPLGLGAFAQELRASGDAIIALYARLDAVSPRTPDAVMALL